MSIKDLKVNRKSVQKQRRIVVQESLITDQQ